MKLKTLLLLIFLIIQPGINLVSAQNELPIVAVSQFESTFNNDGRYRARTNVDNFEVMLETQLLQVGRFQVYERNRLDQILSEQGLQNSFSANGTGIKIDGIDYLIYGAITNYTSNLETFNTGNFSTQKLITRFGVDIKISDTLTGEIRRAESILVTMDTGSAISTNDFEQTNLSNSSLADAQRKAAKLSAAVLTESIFPIRVVDVDNGEIYLNYGDSILSLNDELRVVREGREIIDLDTGISLGSRETEIAKIRITETNDGFSKAEIIEGEQPEIGNLARMNVTNNITNNAQQTQRAPRGRSI
jgi:curli biogenesis system outer membrane secretion channel CsgG